MDSELRVRQKDSGFNYNLLESMVMAFRVTELQALLGFAGKNKTGRKNELQARALELVKVKSPPIVMKIRELYRSIQLSNYGQPLNTSLGASNTSSLVGSRASNSSGSGYGSYSTELKVNSDSASSAFGRSVGYQRVIGGDGQSRTVPICPDIKMKELPFYDILAVLLRPTSLLNQGGSPKQESQHSFCLSPSQAGDITNSREVVNGDGTSYPLTKIQYLVQVQLRFCVLDSSAEQEDLFPQGLVVKVNGRPVQLPAPIPSNRPGVEPKRPSKPLNITTNVKCCPLSTNTIHVQWLADAQKSYCMQINMVKKLTADQLFSRLKAKRIQPADFTRGRIKEITTAEEEDLCAPTSIRVSVACPLGKSRMTWPCRATTCKHLQCFDANLFLLMNERKPTFVCPVCNKQLKFGDLCIDGYFMDVIKNLSIDAGNDIELFPDGRWLPAVKVKSETEDVGPPAAKRMKPTEPAPSKGPNETIDLDDDIVAILDEDELDRKPNTHQAQSSSANTSSKQSQAEPEVIDLLDSSDEEEETPSAAATPRAPEEETVQSVLSQPPQQEQTNQESSEEEIGIRPRRRKTKISYVEESSSDSSTTNEGVPSSSAPASSSAHTPRSPACIELSDSPSPEPRPFASVGSGSSSSHHQSSSSTNNRSGSGSSSTTTSLYSSSPMATTTTVQTPTVAQAGTGSSSGSAELSLHPTYHPLPYSTSLHPAYYSSSTTYSTSASSSNLAPTSAGIHNYQQASAVSGGGAAVSSSTTASHFFPPNMSVPGYNAFDSSRLLQGATTSIPSWEDDLSTFLGQHSLSYSSGPALDSLTGSTSLLDDYINVASAAAVSGHHPFSTSSSTSSSTLSGLYPHQGAGAGGRSGFSGGWM